MKFRFPALVAALTLLAFACKKDAPEAGLPPATQTGANTGGFLVNGQPFQATGWPGYSSLLTTVQPVSGVSGGFLNDTTVCVQLAGLYESRKTYLDIYVRCHGPGVYKFNQTTISYNSGPVSPSILNYALLHQRSAAGQSSATERFYQTNAAHTGTLMLTRVDVARGVVAGQFEFRAQDQASQTTIEISKGRFDCGP